MHLQFIQFLYLSSAASAADAAANFQLKQRRQPAQSVFLRAGSAVSEGSAITLRSLFDCGSYDGGQQEAQAAYDEAVNAVFNLQVECHRHAQPHVSKKDGRTKWAMIEMWPMQVCLPPFCLRYLHIVRKPEAFSPRRF